MQEKSVCVAILAAGSSTRMGVSKLTMPFMGTTLLDRAIRSALDCCAQKVVVISGDHREAVSQIINEYPIPEAYNADWAQGQSTSVITAVEYCRENHFDSLLVMLADQPAVSSDILKKLIDCSKKSTHKAYVSRTGDREGSPCLFRSDCFSDLIKLKGDVGARSVYRRWPADAVTYVSFTEKMLFSDVDTYEDAEKMAKFFQGTQK